MKKLVELYKIEQNIEKNKKFSQSTYILDLYSEAIRIRQTLPNKLGLAKTIIEKADFLKNCGYLEKALKNYNIALNIARDSPNSQFLNLLLNRIHIISK